MRTVFFIFYPYAQLTLICAIVAIIIEILKPPAMPGRIELDVSGVMTIKASYDIITMVPQAKVKIKNGILL